MRRSVVNVVIAFGLTAALTGAVSACSETSQTGHRVAAKADRATLTGWARLPAESFVPGSEPSGSALGTEPINGVQPPFAHQPIQGFSGDPLRVRIYPRDHVLTYSRRGA